MQDSLSLNNIIVAEVQKRTGLVFPWIDSMNTRDRSVANAVLPILKEWVPVVEATNIRHALFARFHTPHAYPHMDSIVGWWESEKDALCESCLVQVLAVLARPRDAERLWSLCKFASARIG